MEGGVGGGGGYKCQQSVKRFGHLSVVSYILGFLLVVSEMVIND